MQCLNKILLILFIYLFSSLPILAYSSNNAIVITRKAAPGKALLDRKFIFMQEGGSSKLKAESSMLKAQSSTQLNSYSSKSLIPIKPSNVNSNKKNTIQHSASNVEPAKDNWDAYAEDVPVELEESLGVEAKLIR